MLPNPSDIKYFQELYQVQNISRAAERLGITQPSLSLALKRLEHTLGLTLFIRSKSGATPTKEANIFYGEITKLLDDWERIGQRAKDIVNQAQGNVRLGCHPAVAQYAIDPWVQALLKKHPHLELSFYHDLSRKVLEQVISFKLDLGLVINPFLHPDLVILPLAQDLVTLRKVSNKKCDTNTLIYDPALAQAQHLIQKLKKKKLTFKRHITTSSLELVEKLTAIGAGVGILPSRTCSVPMTEFSTKVKPFKDQLSLVYRADLPKTKSITTVIEAIKAASF